MFLVFSAWSHSKFSSKMGIFSFQRGRTDKLIPRRASQPSENLIISQCENLLMPQTQRGIFQWKPHSSVPQVPKKGISIFLLHNNPCAFLMHSIFILKWIIWGFPARFGFPIPGSVQGQAGIVEGAMRWAVRSLHPKTFHDFWSSRNMKIHQYLNV